MITIPETRAVDEFLHPALFYRSTEEYLDGTVPFIRDGLAAGEPVAVAVPGSKLRLILAELGTDADRVHFLDMTRVGRNPGRIIPGVLSAFADAHATERVRIIGEPVWVGRTAMEYPACAQHEALINLAFAGRPVTILCPYNAEQLAPQILADAEATHPVLVDNSGSRNSAEYAPERIIAQYNRPLPRPVVPKLTFNATTLAQARRFASEHATRLGLGGDHTELELIVTELTANSVAYGGGNGTLYIWAEDGYLICEVSDTGYIADPLAGRRPASRHQQSGRGLLLVNHLSDLVRLHTTPEGTTIRLYVALPAQNVHSMSSGLMTPAAPALSSAVPASGTIAAGPANLRTGRGTSPDRTPLRWQTHDAMRAASRFARYLPPDAASQSQLRLERSQLRPVLDALAAAEVLAQVVELWRVRLVKLARERGARWSDIGRALGVTKQAAHERYGRPRKRTATRQPPPSPDIDTAAPD